MANVLAYGFVGLEELFDRRITDLSNIEVIDRAVTASLAAHNAEVDQLLALAVTRVTFAQERYRLPGGGTLQPLDQWGVPLPVMGGLYTDIAFPIQGGGTAWGTNRVSNAMMTVAEANDFTVMVQAQDLDWLRRHIMGSLLAKESYTWTDPDVGDLTVYPLANGDATLYMRANGDSATANHYIAQAAGIADATNPFPTIYSTLTAYPGNNGPFVSYIASSERTDVINLANFVGVGDADVTLGSASPTLASAPGGVRAFGREVLGKVDGMWIVEWPSLPDGYILSFAQGAPDSAIAMREYPVAPLRGLIPENHSPDGNRLERRFIRYAGFGGRNRTAAVAYFVGAGDTTYDTPAGYAPMIAV